MVIMDGLGDHFGVLFGTKMWLKQYVFACFCLGGPPGVSLVSFICFGLAWVAIWGPHGVLTKHTKTENRKKNKREQNTPSKAEQLQCAFRFAARPGLQAHGHHGWPG